MVEGPGFGAIVITIHIHLHIHLHIHIRRQKACTPQPIVIIIITSTIQKNINNNTLQRKIRLRVQSLLRQCELWRGGVELWSSAVAAHSGWAEFQHQPATELGSYSV